MVAISVQVRGANHIGDSRVMACVMGVLVVAL